VTSLLFVCVVLVLFCTFLLLLARCCLIAAVVAIGVFLRSFTIISTHRQHHVASEMGFKQDSPNSNLDSDSLVECSYFTETRFGFTTYPNPDSLVEYPPRILNAPVVCVM